MFPQRRETVIETVSRRKEAGRHAACFPTRPNHSRTYFPPAGIAPARQLSARPLRGKLKKGRPGSGRPVKRMHQGRYIVFPASG